MAAFQFHLQSGKHRKLPPRRESGCSWSKIPWWDRKCETVRCRDAIASSFVAMFGAKSSHTFTQSPYLDFAFSPVSPFSVSVSLDFACTAHAFFPERLFNHCQGLCGTSSEICIRFDAVSLPDP
jgi:hypothetical protein